MKNKEKMYYLITTDVDGKATGYVHGIYENSSTETVQQFQRALILNAKALLKFYGMGKIDDYTICELELDNRVQLQYDFIPLVAKSAKENPKKNHKTTVKD